MKSDSDAKRLQEAAKAVELARAAGNQAGLAAALRSLAYLERQLKLDEAALEHYVAAADICRAENNLLALAHNVRHVGDMQRQAGRADLADPCYAEAIGIYRSNRETPPLDLANALRGMALNKEATGDKTGARALWLEARSLYEGANVNEGVAECDRRVAKLV